MEIISRKAAKALGLKRYFTGESCKYGHSAERIVSSKCCLECNNLKSKSDPIGRRERVKKSRLKDPERARENNRKSQRKNKEKRNTYSREYGRRNRAKMREYNRTWRAENPYAYNKLANLLRTRLRVALKGKQKNGSAIRDLGCSLDEFKKYIEAKFTDGMSWENHGIFWHLDHIRNLASVDLTDRDQFIAACHYSNLQPLAVAEHRKKTAAEIKTYWLKEQS